MKRVFFIALIVASAVTTALGHKFHTTLTRIDHRSKEKTLEITIRMFTHDVKPMLERRLGKSIDLGKSSETDGELFKYVSENFLLQTDAGDSVKIAWVGREFENDVLFVYVEAPFDGEFPKLSLQNMLFFELFPEQSNLVVARSGGRKYDLAFRVGDKVKRFDEPRDGKKTGN